MFQEDRVFIENKYHQVNQPFNPYNRMAYHGYEFDHSTGMDDDEILSDLQQLAEETKNMQHPVAKAYAVKYVLENTRIDVNEHDWFVGIWSLNRLANRVTVDKWNNEVFSRIIPETGERMKNMNASAAVSIWPDFDHVVPDWHSILTLGFPGLIKRVEYYQAECQKKQSCTDEQEAFFEGILIEYRAIIDIIDRLYRCALSKTHEKASKIARCLKNIRDGAPSDSYEAMQTIFLFFLFSECFDSYQVRSLGNGLDASLEAFYRKDLASGTYTREEIREFLRYFLMQWSAIGNYWGQPFYLGGTNEDGSTRYQEVSYEILDVYDELNIYNPKIQLKLNENTPDSILNKALDMIRRGHNSLVFCCEPGMRRAVMRYGATEKEAYHIDIRGCYETGVRANEVSTGTGYVNAAKAVLYALSNGYDVRLKKQFGLQTGAPEDLQSFDDFYHAVLKQWEFLIEMTITVALDYERYLGYINPSNMYSATIETALKKGTDAYQCGVKFNNSALLNCGFASLVDSVMAIKEWVYDKKALTLSQMAKALENNWSGYETLQTQIRKSRHKYGNNDPETDRYTEALSAFFTSKVANRPNARGGIFKPVMHSAMQFVWQGEATGATPDGRCSGEELSKNASPSIGMDKSGVTALINSVRSTEPSAYLEGHCLDIMLHPSVTNGEDGLRVMKQLLSVYLKNGGQSIQFNVFHPQTLREAQKHPEKYQNLQVRVCGWNVLWNNLSEKEQNAYLKKAENAMA